MFKRNEGFLDRIVRVVLGTVLLPTGLLLGGLTGSIYGLVAIGLGAIGLITGLTGVCPSYNLFGFSTLEKEKGLFARCASMMTGRMSGNSWTGPMCLPGQQSREETRSPQE